MAIVVLQMKWTAKGKRQQNTTHVIEQHSFYFDCLAVHYYFASNSKNGKKIKWCFVRFKVLHLSELTEVETRRIFERRRKTLIQSKKIEINGIHIEKYIFKRKTKTKKPTTKLIQSLTLYKWNYSNSGLRWMSKLY